MPSAATPTAAGVGRRERADALLAVRRADRGGTAWDLDHADRGGMRGTPQLLQSRGWWQGVGARTVPGRSGGRDLLGSGGRARGVFGAMEPSLVRLARQAGVRRLCRCGSAQHSEAVPRTRSEDMSSLPSCVIRVPEAAIMDIPRICEKSPKAVWLGNQAMLVWEQYFSPERELPTLALTCVALRQQVTRPAHIIALAAPFVPFHELRARWRAKALVQNALVRTRKRKRSWSQSQTLRTSRNQPRRQRRNL
jgi:hypothetical protein